MREWLVIELTRGRGVFAEDAEREWKGYIPRDAAEAILGRSMDGTVWFNSDESEKLHAHPEWRDSEPPPTQNEGKA